MTSTCRCGRPTSGATLCGDCAHTLDVALGNIPAHYADLDTLRAKQTRYGSNASKGSIGKTQPLAIDARFAKGGAGTRVETATRNAVATWSRIVMEDQPELSGPVCATSCLHVSCAQIRRRRWPADTVKSMCAYLQRQLRLIAGQEWAGEMLADMLSLERSLSRLVDRPAERWYAGKCSATDGSDNQCTAELYATADKGTILCRACGTRHNVGVRREYLLREAQGYYVTATEAAGALLAWTDYDGNEHGLRDLIRKWRERGRLETRGNVTIGGKARHLYRLGDVQALLIEHAQHAQKRRMSKSA